MEKARHRSQKKKRNLHCRFYERLQAVACGFSTNPLEPDLGTRSRQGIRNPNAQTIEGLVCCPSEILQQQS